MAKKKNLEDALNQLEEITQEMEEGGLSLDNSLKKFNEGMKLVEFCNQKLDEAQQKVEILTRKEDDTLESEPFPLEDKLREQEE
ncbi:MAG: exodeoxyribonuclease VII small subunit [Desulfurivibrionaceae bacterium]